MQGTRESHPLENRGERVQEDDRFFLSGKKEQVKRTCHCWNSVRNTIRDWTITHPAQKESTGPRRWKKGLRERPRGQKTREALKEAVPQCTPGQKGKTTQKKAVTHSKRASKGTGNAADPTTSAARLAHKNHQKLTGKQTRKG